MIFLKKILEKINFGKMSGFTAESIRKATNKITSLIQPMKNVTVKNYVIDDLSIDLVNASSEGKHGAIIYLHGGGYVVGSVNNYHDLVSRISRVSGLPVFLVDYRLAPEHDVFVDALDDIIKAYEWIMLLGNEPSTIVIGGDSAGGGLTISTLLKLKKLGYELPIACFCLSPWVDLTLSGSSIHDNAKVDPLASPNLLKFFAKISLNGRNPKVPSISPLFGDLSGLPPLLVQVGSHECLLDDAIRLAKTADLAGVNVTIDIWSEMTHVFQMFASVVPEAKEAVQKIGDFIKTYLPKT